MKAIKTVSWKVLLQAARGRFSWKEQKKIRGIEGMTPAQVEYEVQRGGRFVAYQYCVSALVVSFRRNSDIFFIRAGKGSFLKGLKYSLLSMVAGWWAKEGLVWTVKALATNLRGGKNVTKKIMTSPGFKRPMTTFSSLNRTTPQTASYHSDQNLTSQKEAVPGNSKYCPYCGTQIRQPTTYCSNCGKRIQPESPDLQAGGQREKAQVPGTAENPETPLGATWPITRGFDSLVGVSVFFGRGIEIQSLPECIPDSLYARRAGASVLGKFNKAGVVVELTSEEEVVRAITEIPGVRKFDVIRPREEIPHVAYCKLRESSIVARMVRGLDKNGEMCMTGYANLIGIKSEADVREVVNKFGKMLEEAGLFKPLTPLDRIPYGGRDDPRAYDYFANDSIVWSPGFLPGKVE